MMKFTKIARGLVSGLSILALLGAQAAFAQTATSTSTIPPQFQGFPGTSQVAAPAGTTDCSQYYNFGSVQADIDSSVASVVSGTPITFTGTIKNSNPYPIVDGGLYVKVFKLNGTAKNVNGPDVVDQFFVRDGIDLPAEGSQPIVFTWNVPSYAASGQYQIATFFTAADEFNLLGLNFTNDVVGNTADFSVDGELTTGVAFDNTSVTVAGAPYHFASFPPNVSATSSVPVQATIDNTTNAAVSVPVTWSLYEWDGLSQQNLVQHVQTTVTIPANSSAPVTFTATDTTYPVYLLEGTVNWGNTQSIIDVRFARVGIDRLRINFPGVTAFPLKAGVPAALFSCLYNSGTSASVPNGKLVLTLTDASGNVIDQQTYQGDVTGNMMGVAYTFTPKENYDTFNLNAQLYQAGTLVDQATMQYNCTDIDPNSCLPASEKGPSLMDTLETPVVIVVGGLILIILLCAGLWRALRRRPNSIA